MFDESVKKMREQDRRAEGLMKGKERRGGNGVTYLN